MLRTEYEEVNETSSTIEKRATYISEDLGENKCFDNIFDKYNAYRFEEHVQLLRDEFDCQSYSTMLFSIIFIINGNEKKFFLFVGILEIYDRDFIEYTTSAIHEDTEEREKVVNELLKNNLYDKVFIKAEVEIKFYKNRGLDLMRHYEDEQTEDLYDEGDDDDDLTPLPIEKPFISENCSICLITKPDILIIPCLHQSFCSQCEEAGKLTKCPTCRKIIIRKIKI